MIRLRRLAAIAVAALAVVPADAEIVHRLGALRTLEDAAAGDLHALEESALGSFSTSMSMAEEFAATWSTRTSRMRKKKRKRRKEDASGEGKRGKGRSKMAKRKHRGNKSSKAGDGPKSSKAGGGSAKAGKRGGSSKSSKETKTTSTTFPLTGDAQEDIAFVARCLSDPLGELSQDSCGSSADFNGDGVLDLRDLKDILAFSFTNYPAKDLAPLFPDMIDVAMEYWPPYQPNDIAGLPVQPISGIETDPINSDAKTDECPGPDTYQLPWAPASLCTEDEEGEVKVSSNESPSTRQLGQDEQDIGVPTWTNEHRRLQSQPTCGLGTSGRFGKGNKNQDPAREWENQYPYDPDFELNLFEASGGVVWFATYFAGIPVWFGARGWTEAVAAFFHYQWGEGLPRQTDYEEAYNEDSTIKKAVNDEVNEVLRAVKELHDGQEASFEFYSTDTRSVRSDAGGEWAAVLGKHQIWSSGSASYDPNACSLSVDITIKAEDFYDFGEWDGSFRDQFVNLIPGSFSSLGWADGYITTGEITRTETIDLQCCKNEDCGDPTEFDCECNLCVTQCPTQQTSGGQGFHSFSVDLGGTWGTFYVSWQLYEIPDELNVYYEGVQIFSTGVWSGSGYYLVGFGGPTSTSTTVTVEINAPSPGTLWVISVGCKCPPEQCECGIMCL